MPQKLTRPQIYLITNGETTRATTPATDDFANLLKLVRAAADAGINLVQLREKNLSARTLFDLTVCAAAITHGTQTRLLVNDRADIAQSAGADGVHLTTSSLEAAVVRKTFGSELLIGVSTHSEAEVVAARDQEADFVVFGPVFETRSKSQYGSAAGVSQLARVVSRVRPFPVLALGGVTLDNVSECFRTGACGIAGISLLSNPDHLETIVERIRAEAERTVDDEG